MGSSASIGAEAVCSEAVGFPRQDRRSAGQARKGFAASSMYTKLTQPGKSAGTRPLSKLMTDVTQLLSCLRKQASRVPLGGSGFGVLRPTAERLD